MEAGKWGGPGNLMGRGAVEGHPIEPYGRKACALC